MKLIKKGSVDWKFSFTCLECDSELEAEAGDLRHKEIPGCSDMRDYSPATDQYSVGCIVCSASKIIPEKDIPKNVKREAKIRCKPSPSYYGDR